MGLECELAPRWLYVWILGPRLVVLFGKDVEPLGGEALLEEASHQELALMFDSVASLPT